MILERVHKAIALAPVADAFSGTVNTDVFNVENYQKVLFTIVKGAGATGTTVVTVNSNSSNSTSGGTAETFRYRVSTATDTFGAVTDATTSGFTTTAGANQVYLIEFDVSTITAGNSWVFLTCTESVNDPCVGSIMAEFEYPRYVEATMPTAIA